MLTKKHFVAIAEAISRLPPNHTTEDVARAIARVLATFNLRFDTDRFLTACGG